MTYPLITEKMVKENTLVKRIQKENIKSHRHVKGHYPKVKLGKVVKLKGKDSFIDCVKSNIEEKSITLKDFSAEQIVKVIHQQKIYGFGGGAFPTSRKMETVKQSSFEKKYLVINGVACDPGLLHDKWLMENHMLEIQKAIEIISKYISFEKIVLATKEKNVVVNAPITVQMVPNRYPMGAEKILVKQVLNITLSESEITAEHGILVLNVQTMYAIYNAFYGKEDGKTKYITVADMNSGEAVVAKVCLEQNVNEVLEETFPGQWSKEDQVYYGGGIMLGTKADSKDTITENINFIGFGKTAVYEIESRCKKCGVCAKKCPMNIKVNKIIQAVEKQDLEVIKEYHPEKCLQCGACTYYCKAGKNTMGIVNLQIEKLV